MGINGILAFTSFFVTKSQICCVKIIYEDDAIFVGDQAGNNFYIKFNQGQQTESSLNKSVLDTQVFLLKTIEGMKKTIVEEKFEVNNFRYYYDKQSNKIEIWFTAKKGTLYIFEKVLESEGKTCDFNFNIQSMKTSNLRFEQDFIEASRCYEIEDSIDKAKPIILKSTRLSDEKIR